MLDRDLPSMMPGVTGFQPESLVDMRPTVTEFPLQRMQLTGGRQSETIGFHLRLRKGKLLGTPGPRRFQRFHPFRLDSIRLGPPSVHPPEISRGPASRSASQTFAGMTKSMTSRLAGELRRSRRVKTSTNLQIGRSQGQTWA